MEYKKTIILLALVVFLLSIAGVSASEIGDTIASENANTIELSTDNDIEDNLQTSEENMVFTSTDYDEAIAQTDTEVLGADSAKYSDLANEINQSGNITLTHKNYTYDEGAKAITISEDNKVIDGNGAVIDMNGSTIRAFHVSASGVTIKNLTIKNANYNGRGGAIYFDSSATSGTVTNCNFVDNTADNGGAVYFQSTGTVTNCNFTGNTATYYGGAVYFRNVGEVTNCNFTNNKATGEYRYGGAVYFLNNGEVTNCNFTNNSARYGGAINMDSGNVTNCNFTGNTADNGGAINMGSGTVSNCNFTNNTASDWGGAVYFENSGNVTNCNFTNNTATRDGGAVYFENSGNVTNCNFTNNKATGTGNYNGGGAVYLQGTGSLTNCNFTNNKATGTGNYDGGGAVYFYSAGSVTNCNFTDNSATVNGGAVYFYDDGSVSNCNFADTTAGGAVYFQSTGNVTNCNFTDNSATVNGGAINMGSGSVSNCNFAGNTATRYGGAVYFQSTGNVTNCNFTGNTATDYGGAVYFNVNGEVTNCNFTGNNANVGGAVYFNGKSEVTNCNFTGNTATDYGGAIWIYSGTVSNCNFTGNNATTGSAIYFWSISASKTVSNSCFLNNRANAEALDVVKNDNNITITFTGHNNLLNAIYSREDAEVAFTNVKYWGATGITTVSARLSGFNKAAGQNITVGVVVNNELVLSDVMVTNESGMIVLDISAGENYYISARHDTDSYYTEAERTISNNTKFNVNVTSQTTNNKTVNITAKSNIFREVMPGKLLFILPNGTQIEAAYGSNGTWWAEHTFDAYGEYKINATYVGLDNVTINNGTITINKLKTELTGNAITTTYNINKNLVITLKDSTGKALSGVSVTVDLNGAKTYTTDKNGQVKVPTKALGVKTYTAKITFNGDANHDKSTKDIKVTVKKATPKMTAKKKTFKVKTKTKKYTIALKDNTGKAMKKVKVTLKVKGKTYTAKTNKKGKATFKIKNLKKKGKYKAVIKYKGDKNYNKITKKVTLKVKK